VHRIDLTNLTEADLTRACLKWQALSPNHHATSFDTTIDRLFFRIDVYTAGGRLPDNRLTFKFLFHKAGLHIELGVSSENDAVWYLDLAKVPTDPETIHEAWSAQVKELGQKKRMGLLRKNKDFLIKSYLDLLSLFAPPERGDQTITDYEESWSNFS
jgi:hypothetical protein